MFIVLLCSAVLVIIPISFVQYHRFLSLTPAPEQYDRFPKLSTDLQVAPNRGNASLDGPASDTASEGPSEAHPVHPATTSGYERRETRKPWDPPFPMRPRTSREPYLVLPRSKEGERDEHNARGRDEESRWTSQMAPEEDDGVMKIGHLPVTDLPSSSAAIPAPGASTQTTPEPKPATTGKRGTPSLVQMVVLVLALIIFVFAFAILVAHCMAWFVVYKTEARLGEVRKGLLRGGDMRVCLCGR
ncbi:hypothetical protein PMIN01_03847 [Paraphaeosphaeria minitans]|uniref:Uncharacterized protein n=1 Tax=Paraphaeosphaeria minitans TaxID=565426 RepID=A0A9P6KU89_9PLEO|nr:hypothetical protein PMIN01_03847 [Paraphaeosphaeria minitans]